MAWPKKYFLKKKEGFGKEGRGGWEQYVGEIKTKGGGKDPGFRLIQLILYLLLPWPPRSSQVIGFTTA